MKANTMRYLREKYFIQNDSDETYSLSNDIQEYTNDSSFVQMFKEAVEFLENKYY